MIKNGNSAEEYNKLLFLFLILDHLTLKEKIKYRFQAILFGE